MSPKSFRVSRESPLLPFLLEACRSCSRTTVKSYLSHNQVEVNGRIVARFDHALSPGDEVAVFPGRRVEPLRHPMLRIVYEDWLIVPTSGAACCRSVRSANGPVRPTIS
ncbi:MAG: MoaD/ThiS family protein [Alistipes ihumii]